MQVKYLHIIGDKMSEAETQAQPVTGKENVNLQLSDLVSALETIQLAASRGAFRPEEFTNIGATYERIFLFLESTGAVSRPDATEQK